MKILVSADHHIKLNTKNIPVDWAKNRFKMLFDQLHALEKTVDMHVLAGDFFDKVPTLEELELYYDFVSGCKCETWIIPGNHEALKKDTTFLTYLKGITNRLNEKVGIVDDYFTWKGIDFIPYNVLKDYAKNPKDFDFEYNLLITHVRGEIPPHVKAEVDLSIFDKWKVVLAGDLHSYSNSQRNILYPGSPITTSFHRSSMDTGVIIIDTDTLTHEWIKLDVPQLIRKTIQAGEPMLPTEYHHTIYEIEGDMASLANIEDSVLMDKKVTKRSNDTTLILSPEMTLEQEVQEYLSYILELPEETVNKVLKEYNDYSKNITLE